MTRDGSYTGVIDRFEDDLAVILLEEDGETVDELVLDRDDLPEDGRHVDAVLSIAFDSGSIATIDYQSEETNERSNAAQRRFDELSQRPPSSDDETE